MNKQPSNKTALLILYALAAIGIVVIIYRFAAGIGPVSNLSDAYPWGLWIAIDVLTGVALAAGGFTLAAIVYIFNLKQFHSVIRPAILTAFLGYVFVVIGLIVDLGRSYEIYKAIFNWNNSSAMFEVAWCVMLYTSVLALEFLPVVIEKYKLTGLQGIYDPLASWLSILFVSFFVYLMTGNPVLAGIVFALLGVIWFIFKFALPKGATMLLAIMAGIIFSTAHQSSLGTLFHIVMPKLSDLWWTQSLFINFYTSAVAVGLAMVIFESTLSSKFFGFGLEEKVIKGLGKILPWLILIALATRLGTFLAETGFSFANASGGQIFAFWLEILLGLVIPFIMLLLPATKESPKAIFNASTLVVLGVIINRINVTITAYTTQNAPNYYPHILEILITVGIISIGVLAFRWICINFPVFEHEE